MPGVESLSDPVPGLGIFSKPADTCPVTTLRGCLKQVSRARLTELQINVLNNVFSGFIRGVISPVEHAGYVALAESAGISYRHGEYIPRRFSGDVSLPPGRYSTMCSPDGDDDGTLTGELNSYLSSDTAEGHVEILDAGVPRQRDSLQKAGFSAGPRIILQYYPFAQEATREKPLVVSQTLEYNISDVVIRNVLDLRRPGHRDLLGVPYQHASKGSSNSGPHDSHVARRHQEGSIRPWPLHNEQRIARLRRGYAEQV